MAHICFKPKGSCQSCKDYRFDENREDYACFMDDEKMVQQYQEHLLWNILKDHLGHKVEIACYGDPDNPASITLEDLDTNEVILDAGIYTICAREDV